MLLGSEEVVLRSEDARGLDLDMQASCEAPWSLVGRGSGKQFHTTIRLGTLFARAEVFGSRVGVGAVMLDGWAGARRLSRFGDSIVRHCGTAFDARSSPKLSPFEGLMAFETRLGIVSGGRQTQLPWPKLKLKPGGSRPTWSNPCMFLGHLQEPPPLLSPGCSSSPSSTR